MPAKLPQSVIDAEARRAAMAASLVQAPPPVQGAAPPAVSEPAVAPAPAQVAATPAAHAPARAHTQSLRDQMQALFDEGRKHQKFGTAAFQALVNKHRDLRGQERFLQGAFGIPAAPPIPAPGGTPPAQFTTPGPSPIMNVPAGDALDQLRGTV